MTATIPLNVQTNLLLFTLLSACVVLLYALTMVFGVKRLGRLDTQPVDMRSPQTVIWSAAAQRLKQPLNRGLPRPTASPQTIVRNEHEQLMQEYRSRLEKLDETLKTIENKLKASTNQTAAAQNAESCDTSEDRLDLGDLRELLSLATSIRDEFSKLVSQRPVYVKQTNQR